MNKLNVKLLEYFSDVYEGSPYANILVRLNDRIVRFKLDVKKVAKVDSALLDKMVDVEVEIAPDFKGNAYVKVVSVTASK